MDSVIVYLQLAATLYIVVVVTLLKLKQKSLVDPAIQIAQLHSANILEAMKLKEEAMRLHTKQWANAYLEEHRQEHFRQAIKDYDAAIQERRDELYVVAWFFVSGLPDEHRESFIDTFLKGTSTEFKEWLVELREEEAQGLRKQRLQLTLDYTDAQIGPVKPS